MKVSFVFVLFAAFFLAVVLAEPIPATHKKFEMELSAMDKNKTTDDTEVPKERSKRATCDLLSVDTPIGSLNHSACAAHCLTLGKGFRGGRCIDGVCHCRK